MSSPIAPDDGSFSDRTPDADPTAPVFGPEVSEAGQLRGGEILDQIVPGRILFERYEVRELLAQGGMGVIYLVRHIDLDVLRALKTIVVDLEDNQEILRRFRTEARIMARFLHPNSVTIHDAKFAQGVTFIDMEYIRGQTLTQHVTQGVPQPLDWTARILEQLCGVLQAAHDQGIVHRDVKPTNVMLLDGRPAGREFLKVLDFGLSTIIGLRESSAHRSRPFDGEVEPGDDSFVSGRLVGTPSYMSPEGCRGERAGPAGDLYSLGILLYQLVTGFHPFVSSGQNFSKRDLFQAHLLMTPPPFSQINPDVKVPREIEQLVIRCLAKQPHDRPPSAQAIAEEFLWALPKRVMEPGAPAGATRPGAARLRPPPGYELTEFLGEGAYGAVWKAVDRAGIQVALKYLPVDEPNSRREWEGLQAIKNVRHPNLLVPIQVWESPEHLIVSMELADANLMSVFAERRKQGHSGIERDRLLEYLREAAKGLDFLNQTRHDLGGGRQGYIYHRDIKPQNILLMGGSVKVADFGLARPAQHTTTTRDFGGTLYYMAPEQFEERVARQTDQYALAVTYCQLLTGRLPFEGTAAQLMHAHLSGQPDLTMAPSAEHPVIRRALAKDPRQRWPSCRAFVDALTAAGTAKERARVWGWLTQARGWFSRTLTKPTPAPPTPGPPPTETVTPALPSTKPEIPGHAPEGTGAAGPTRPEPSTDAGLLT